MKYEPQTVFKPLPPVIAMLWIVGVTGLVMFTFWKFYIKTHLFLHNHSAKLSPKHYSNGSSTGDSVGNSPSKRPSTNGKKKTAKTKRS